jgi:hypothetical protein
MALSAMTPSPVCSDATQTIDKYTHLPRNAAFYLLASITVSYLAASSAPTPWWPPGGVRRRLFGKVVRAG